jgi:hypothetical protein
MRLALGIAASVLMIAAPAFAAENVTSSTPSPNEIICKATGPAAATRLKQQRTCMTRAEWKSVTQSHRDEVELAQLRNLQVPIRR